MNEIWMNDKPQRPSFKCALKDSRFMKVERRIMSTAKIEMLGNEAEVLSISAILEFISHNSSPLHGTNSHPLLWLRQTISWYLDPWHLQHPYVHFMFPINSNQIPTSSGEPDATHKVDISPKRYAPLAPSMASAMAKHAKQNTNRHK